MEYVEGGMLFDMCKMMGAMGENVGRFFAKQLVDALSYLHDTLNLAHRDIKPENLLLDEHLNIKMGDFGSCTRPHQALQSLHSYRGT